MKCGAKISESGKALPTPPDPLTVFPGHIFSRHSLNLKSGNRLHLTALKCQPVPGSEMVMCRDRQNWREKRAPCFCLTCSRDVSTAWQPGTAGFALHCIDLTLAGRNRGSVHTYPFLFEPFFPLQFDLPSYPVKTVTENAFFQKRSPKCICSASRLLVDWRKRRFSNTMMSYIIYF